MSEQSSLSAVSDALLPSCEASAPAQTIPEDIAVYLGDSLEAEAEKECDVVSETVEVYSVPSPLCDKQDASLKQTYPTVLVDIALAEPLGESILTTVLRHACLTGYENTFKHKQKTKYLNALHKAAFKEDGMFNQ